MQHCYIRPEATLEESDELFGRHKRQTKLLSMLFGKKEPVDNEDAEGSQIIPIDARLAEALDRVQVQGFLADGEITDSHFYIWDLLSVNDTDLRIQPYEIRYVHLTRHFRGVSDVCESVKPR
jgi:hypothetical protein